LAGKKVPLDLEIECNKRIFQNVPTISGSEPCWMQKLPAENSGTFCSLKKNKEKENITERNGKKTQNWPQHGRSQSCWMNLWTYWRVSEKHSLGRKIHSSKTNKTVVLTLNCMSITPKIILLGFLFFFWEKKKWLKLLNFLLFCCWW
jgi:hypothetical protein